MILPKMTHFLMVVVIDFKMDMQKHTAHEISHQDKDYEPNFNYLYNTHKYE